MTGTNAGTTLHALKRSVVSPRFSQIHSEGMRVRR